MYRLLIVDDDISTLYAVTTYLLMKDYTVHSSRTGANALIKLPRVKPDLIAISSSLTDMSGFDLCKIIKKEYEDVLVLMIVDPGDSMQEDKAVYAGCDDYIAKDFSGKQLLTKLQSLFRIKDLTNSLKNRYAELAEANKYLELQMSMAQKVQRSIIKDVDLSFKNTRVITKYLPALAIGGDFFNVCPLDSGRLGIILGDVSGHGISSSLLTLMLSQVFLSLCHDIERPSELLKRMNETFYSIFDGSENDLYVCIVYLIIDVNAKTITYSNSGAAYPILADKDGKEAAELELNGIPAGMLRNVNYTDKTVDYNEGDLLFLHTDGLSDFYFKEDSDGFNIRLKELLKKSIDNKSRPEDILKNTLDTFYNESDSKKYKADDISVIICKL